MPHPTPSKKARYHHGNLREALVEAALEILEQEGLDKLSLRAVARRAGVSQTAPYSHFKNKTALLAAVAANGYARFASKMAQGAEGIVHHERFLGYGGAYIAFAVENPALFRLMFGAELCHGFEDYPELIQNSARSYQLISEAVADYLGSVQEPLTDPLVGTTGAWAMVHGLAILILDGRVPPVTINEAELPEFIRKVVAVTAHGLGR